MTDQRHCNTCGVVIQENTAEKTGGLCRPCEGGYRLNIERAKRRGPAKVTLTSSTFQTMDEQTFERLRRERVAPVVARMQAQVEQSPESADAHCALAQVLDRMARQYREALAAYDRAIAIRPRYPEALLCRAQLLLRCRDRQLRDPARALQDANVALQSALENNELQSDWAHRKYLYTLARAHSANMDAQSALAVLMRIVPYANTRISKAALQAALGSAAFNEEF